MSPPPTIAQQLAAKQREISVAEFFERNRQILGFDNPQRALLTTVKECVDNSLDACDEARILPDVLVEISKETDERLRVAVTDNGPGILRREIPNVFARLLYGSRFHSNRQARGQQGIGVSAAVLYANLTTARPAHVVSKVEEDEAAHVLDLVIDTQKNQPRVVSEDVTLWDSPHGTRVELILKARYVRGRNPPTSTSAGPRSSTRTHGSCWSNRTAPGSRSSGRARSCLRSRRRPFRTRTVLSSGNSATF